jgi:hypothetical protein
VRPVIRKSLVFQVGAGAAYVYGHSATSIFAFILADHERADFVHFVLRYLSIATIFTASRDGSKLDKCAHSITRNGPGLRYVCGLLLADNRFER